MPRAGGAATGCPRIVHCKVGGEWVQMGLTAHAFPLCTPPHLHIELAPLGVHQETPAGCTRELCPAAEESMTPSQPPPPECLTFTYVPTSSPRSPHFPVAGRMGTSPGTALSTRSGSLLGLTHQRPPGDSVSGGSGGKPFAWPKALRSNALSPNPRSCENNAPRQSNRRCCFRGFWCRVLLCPLQIRPPSPSFVRTTPRTRAVARAGGRQHGDHPEQLHGAQRPLPTDPCGRGRSHAPGNRKVG